MALCPVGCAGWPGRCLVAGRRGLSPSLVPLGLPGLPWPGRFLVALWGAGSRLALLALCAWLCGLARLLFGGWPVRSRRLSLPPPPFSGRPAGLRARRPPVPALLLAFLLAWFSPAPWVERWLPRLSVLSPLRPPASVHLSVSLLPAGWPQLVGRRGRRPGRAHPPSPLAVLLLGCPLACLLGCLLACPLALAAAAAGLAAALPCCLLAGPPACLPAGSCCCCCCCCCCGCLFCRLCCRCRFCCRSWACRRACPRAGLPACPLACPACWPGSGFGSAVGCLGAAAGLVFLSLVGLSSCITFVL